MGYLGEEFTEGEIGYLAGIQASRAVLTDNGDMVLADAAKRLCEESERIRRRESVATTDDIDEILRRKRAELT